MVRRINVGTLVNKLRKSGFSVDKNVVQYKEGDDIKYTCYLTKSNNKIEAIRINYSLCTSNHAHDLIKLISKVYNIPLRYECLVD